MVSPFSGTERVLLLCPRDWKPHGQKGQRYHAPETGETTALSEFPSLERRCSIFSMPEMERIPKRWRFPEAEREHPLYPREDPTLRANAEQLCIYNRTDFCKQAEQGAGVGDKWGREALLQKYKRNTPSLATSVLHTSCTKQLCHVWSQLRQKAFLISLESACALEWYVLQPPLMESAACVAMLNCM